MESNAILTTFVAASALGYLLILIAREFRLSAIAILLLGGIIAGPEFVGVVKPHSLGDTLNTFISLAVGLILFEGGLTLDVKGYKQVSSEILGVLTRGVLVTWLVSSVAVKFLFGFGWSFSILAGSLIIVTGPTVIGPLLQRLRVKKNIYNILYWEGVLIDPIGVFIALLCYEWMVSSVAQEMAYLNFFIRFAVGSATGLIAGNIIFHILRKGWVPDERLNLFVIVGAMMTFALSDHLMPESGLLGVTIAGLWLGYKETPQLDRIIEYKDELKDFLIGFLFILLAANLKFSSFASYGWPLALIVVFLMVVVRPLNIFVSTFNSALSLKDKLFLSWIAPRGIVAASMSSLFAFHLTAEGYAEATFLEAFTYAVIGGTVVFQGLTARPVGKLLGVLEARPKGWLIIGAHKVARAVAAFIRENGDSVVLIDTNPREVKLCRRQRLTAIPDNAMTINPSQHLEFYGVGNILAITVNDDLNQLLCQRWQKMIKGARLFYWGFEDFSGDEQQPYRLVGKKIWPKLDLKAILAQNIQYDELISCVSEGPVADFSESEDVLLSRFEGRLFPYVPVDKEGDALFLKLRPVVSPISTNTCEEWMIFSRETRLETLYREMLRVFHDKLSPSEEDRLLVELMAREKEYTSMIGHGVSVPHAYSTETKESFFALAKVSPPVRCSHTGADISLVFMVISPEGHPEEHLTLISRIAKFVVKEETRAALLAGESKGEIYSIVEKG